MCDTLKKCHRSYKKAIHKISFLSKLPQNDTYQDLAHQFNSLSLEDLGIDGPDDPYFFRPEFDRDGLKVPGITVTHIYDNEDYAILLFFLRKGEWLPLHDHEDMAVLARVLTGKIRYRALDKINLKSEPKDPYNIYNYYKNSIAWEAIVKADEIISPQDHSKPINQQNVSLPFFREKENQLVLPYDKNMHYLEAIENASFIDVILPNYYNS